MRDELCQQKKSSKLKAELQDTIKIENRKFKTTNDMESVSVSWENRFI